LEYSITSPQANGLDDRLNQTLLHSLAKFAQDNRETWDENLLDIGYITGIHKAHTI